MIDCGNRLIWVVLYINVEIVANSRSPDHVCMKPKWCKCLYITEAAVTVQDASDAGSKNIFAKPCPSVDLAHIDVGPVPEL